MSRTLREYLCWLVLRQQLREYNYFVAHTRERVNNA